MIGYEQAIRRVLDSASPESTTTMWYINRTVLATPSVIVALPFNGVNRVKALSAVTLLSNSASSPDPNESSLSTSTGESTSVSPNGGQNSMSPTTVVAIGVGTGTAVMILAGIFIWFVMLHRRRSLLRKQGKTQENSSPGQSSWSSELRKELPGDDSRFEVHGEPKRTELSCNPGIAHELEQPREILELGDEQRYRVSAQELHASPRLPDYKLHQTKRASSPVEDYITPVTVASPL